jgi:hypothetical protein
MSDYWQKERKAYVGVSKLFEQIASEQHAEAIEQLARADPLRLGLDVSSTDDRFPPVARWVCEVTGCSEPVRVRLTPNPSKSSGFWQLEVTTVSGHWERYLSPDEVRKLGTL